MHTAPNSWNTVETLGEDTEPTVISSGHITRDFVPLKRFIERALNAAHLGTDIAVDAVYAPILLAHDRREPVDAVIGRDKQKRILQARPLFGPLDRVHGVRYWFGPADQDPPEPSPAAGVVWDLPSNLVHLTVDCTKMAGHPDADFVPTLPLATFWHNADRFDERDAVYNLLSNPGSLGRIRTTGTVHNVTSRHNMQWQVTIRARHDHETVGAWALLEDLTTDQTSPPDDTLDAATCRDFLRAAGTYLGVIHLTYGTVVRWLPDPPPWIDIARAPDQLFPAQDRARLAAAVAPDDRIVLAIGRDDAYTPTRIVLTPYRGSRSGQFAIGCFSRADTRTNH